ncbi:MAG: TetR/AcrR family transcriptional regulator [Roseovarius sp.]|nr:TetR/AcrR family transcriptional regulator [Roseovarius sp.]MCY4291184.1 TetR/AcrR family transcriptional regulator [Roseovarius sp.]MCY4315248.1 TetR/AcrR family transcriptional regulator [Roseovarius sp.]
MLTDDHRQKQERGRDSRAIISELKSWATRQLVDEEPGSLSIKPIIRKAGVSRGALFRHVPIKNHLIAAAVADFLEGASARLAEHVARLRGSEISISQFGSIPCSCGLLRARLLIGGRLLARFGTAHSIFGMCRMKTFGNIASSLLRGQAFSTSCRGSLNEAEPFHAMFESMIPRDAVVRDIG